MTPTAPGEAGLRPVPGNPVANWIQALRPRFYIATVVPVATGLLLAAHDGHFDATLAVITLLGALAMHAGTNLANDYYDWVQYTGDLPYHGGSGVIQEGKIPPEAVKRAALLTFAAAFAAGLYLSTVAGLPVLMFTLLGLLGAYFYSAPPVRFGYRGLAEVVCGLSMGPVIVLGTYYTQAGRLSAEALAASLPLASFVAFILFGESIPDIDEDRQTGKWTVAARLGQRRAIQVYVLWIVLTGLAVAALAAAGLLPPLLLAELVVMALVLRAVRPLLAGTGPGAGAAAGSGGAAPAPGGDAAERERARLSRLGKMALALYLSTGLLLIIGLALRG